LFFKWIKQHLRIKALYGTSENSVKTQIGIAISTLYFSPSLGIISGNAFRVFHPARLQKI